MKLYLSSYRIPAPDKLAQLIGKTLDKTTVALITNAKDYYIERARSFTVKRLTDYMEQLGLEVTTVDLREYDDAKALQETLSQFDLIWAMGGNTYMLRHEMQRSGFAAIIDDLLKQGIVYGGDSAGALVAGASIAGVELADEPAFAETIITDGLHLVPFAILPHVDNPEFTDVLPVFREVQQGVEIIELKDSQAVIFSDEGYTIVENSTNS